MSEGNPIAGQIILIHAGHDTCHASTAPRDVKRKTELCHNYPRFSLDFLYQFTPFKNYQLSAMGVSFQGPNHFYGDCGTAPKSCGIMVAAPQRKVA